MYSANSVNCNLWCLTLSGSTLCVLTGLVLWYEFGCLPGCIASEAHQLFWTVFELTNVFLLISFLPKPGRVHFYRLQWGVMADINLLYQIICEILVRKEEMCFCSTNIFQNWMFLSSTFWRYSNLGKRNVPPPTSNIVWVDLQLVQIRKEKKHLSLKP